MAISHHSVLPISNENDSVFAFDWPANLFIVAVFLMSYSMVSFVWTSPRKEKQK